VQESPNAMSHLKKGSSSSEQDGLVKNLCRI
jgi:hypothetical protein